MRALLTATLITAIALAAAETAQSRGAVFKAKLSVRETIQETVTREGCAVQGTITQTVQAATRRTHRVDAFMFERGSLRGVLQLTSGSSDLKFSGPGSVERQSNMGSDRNPCRAPLPGEPPPEPLDCGTRSSSRWPMDVEPQTSSRGRLRGLLPTWDFPGRFPGDEPFDNCASARGAPGDPPLIKISAARLVDRRRHSLTLDVSRSYSARDGDEEFRGTQTWAAKLTLRRVRRVR